MKKMSFAALGLAGALLLAAPAQAHFMIAYTPQTALEKGHGGREGILCPAPAR